MRLSYCASAHPDDLHARNPLSVHPEGSVTSDLNRGFSASCHHSLNENSIELDEITCAASLSGGRVTICALVSTTGLLNFIKITAKGVSLTKEKTTMTFTMSLCGSLTAPGWIPLDRLKRPLVRVADQR